MNIMDSTLFLKIIDNILITGVVYGLIFTAVVFLSKKRKGKPVLFLNLLVLAITLNNLQAWLINMDFVSSIVYIKYLRIPWYFLCMPMFYVFMVHYLRIQQQVVTFLWTTVILFTGTILIRLLLIHMAVINGLEEAVLKGNIEAYSIYEERVSYAYTVILFLYPITMFWKNRKLFEFALNYDDLKWVKDFFLIAGLILLVWIVAQIRSAGTGIFSQKEMYYPLRLSTTVLIYWIGFKGLFRFKIMEDRIVLRENLNKEKLSEQDLKLLDLGNQSIDTSAQKSDKQLKMFEQIDHYVISHQKFLLPDISLESLAADVNLSAGHLSHLINTYGKLNFSDYINKLRIEQSKKFILDPDFVNYTIVAIGLESGFNSKSTFYSAFKKFTNESPSTFKQRNLWAKSA